ncbi:DNA cytosine methyltransferase [Streptomyces sp. B226SN101]|uniref:DNA cytosine methyltransferase n=1 Tax=Streptomyces sp. B226SN101 TaxID=1736043 RepID=UPI0035BC826B
MWLHAARAVEALRPCLVVIENVRGLLTSPAGSPGDVEFCPWCLGDTPDQPPLRALGAVLGSLADLRYDARWLVLRASDIGAPHRRERTFLAAWPAETPCSRRRPATSAGTAARNTPPRGRAGATARTWPTRWSGSCPPRRRRTDPRARPTSGTATAT